MIMDVPEKGVMTRRDTTSRRAVCAFDDAMKATSDLRESSFCGHVYFRTPFNIFSVARQTLPDIMSQART